jgi:hypothetical protein
VLLLVPHRGSRRRLVERDRSLRRFRKLVRVLRTVSCVARWTLGLALVGYGWVLSWVSQAGVVVLAAGGALLLGPWIVRVARGEAQLVPRTHVLTRRALTRAVIIVVAGLAVLTAALVLQSSAGR